MAQTPEAKVKASIKKILDTHGVYSFSPYQAGMGRAGIPDIIACFKGQFLAIEAKAGKGKTTALQDRELSRINEAGGTALVINETNLHLLEEILTVTTGE
jgi:Holliday junction resolvase